MVSFTIGLTGWVDRSRSSVFFTTFIVCVGIVGVRVCLTTIIVVVIVTTIRVISGLVFFSCELTALVSIVTWLFAVVASWFGLFWVLLCGLMPHSCYMLFIWGFQTIQFQLLYRCDAICSYVPFSKCAWLIDFFKWGGILAYMKCSMIAWAGTPNASFPSFWRSSRKSINFRFAGLKTSRWNFCFAVTIDGGCTCFLRNTV